MDVPLKPHGATVAGNPSNGLVNQSLEFSGAVRGLTPQTEVDTGRTVSNARHRDVSASSSAAFAQASGQTTNPDRVLDGDDEQTPRLRHAVLADSQSSSIAAAERNAWPPYVQRPPQHVAHLGLVNQLGPQAYGPMNGGSIPRLGSVPGPAPDNWWTELGNPVLTVNHIHDSRGWNSDQMLNGGNQVFYGANGGDQYGTRIGTFSSSPIPGFRSHGTGGYGPNGYLLVLQIHIPGRLPLPLRGLVWLSSDISFFREGTATQLGLVREQIPPKIRCSSITPLGLVTPTHFTRFVASIGEYQIPTTELAVKVIGWEDPSVDIFLGRAFFSRVGLPVERLVHQPMQPETHGIAAARSEMQAAATGLNDPVGNPYLDDLGPAPNFAPSTGSDWSRVSEPSVSNFWTRATFSSGLSTAPETFGHNHDGNQSDQPTSSSDCFPIAEPLRQSGGTHVDNQAISAHDDLFLDENGVLY